MINLVGKWLEPPLATFEHLSQNISVFAETDFAVRFTVTDAANGVTDLSNSTLTWIGTPSSARVTKTLGAGLAFLTDGTDGVVDLTADETDFLNSVAGGGAHQLLATIGGLTKVVTEGIILVRTNLVTS